jgi:SAM-dependent methyltransferase
MTGSYVLDNGHEVAAVRLAALERLYDPATRANLDAAGLRSGLRCGLRSGLDMWEAGAGAGSVARWAAAKGARVIATDIDLRHLSDQTRALATQILAHDVMTEEPPGTFDLIHARLLLSHLPTWPDVLNRMVAALRPGGWLCVEELDPMLDYAPARADAGDLLVNRVGRAFTAALASRGGDPTLGRKLHPLLADHGLRHVHSGGLILAGTGGSLIAELMAVNVTQTAPMLAARGIEPQELDAYLAAMRDERQVVTMPVFWTVRGQVPA